MAGLAEQSPIGSASSGGAAGLAAPPQRFYGLDVLRAAAALAVLFFHYQHFYFPINGRSAVGVVSEQPLFAVFSLAYQQGALAVQAFWMISGFVFTHVYGSTAATTSGFAVNRIARLYPLHLVTLFLVALLQIAATARFGASQIYGGTDLRHFALHLGLASNWVQDRTYSFNGPIWSVSVEVAVYAVFWCVRRPLFSHGFVMPFVLLAIGSGMTIWFPTCAIGACLAYFFAGAAAYGLYRRIGSRVWLGGLLALGFIAAGWALNGPSITIQRLDFAWMAMCAGILILAALAERRVPARWHGAMGGIGDTTYGIYLWHVPVQLGLILAFGAGLRQVAASPWFLAGFIAAVLVLARLGFVWVERPVSRAIRRRLGRSPALPRIQAP